MCSDDDVENDSAHQVNDADEEDDGEREAKWRTERLEREKFLEEHKVSVSIYRICNSHVQLLSYHQSSSSRW